MSSGTRFTMSSSDVVEACRGKLTPCRRERKTSNDVVENMKNHVVGWCRGSMSWETVPCRGEHKQACRGEHRRMMSSGTTSFRYCTRRQMMSWRTSSEHVVERNVGGCRGEQRRRMSWRTTSEHVVENIVQACRGEHRPSMSWRTSYRYVVENIVQVCRGEHRPRMSWRTSYKYVVENIVQVCRGQHPRRER